MNPTSVVLLDWQENKAADINLSVSISADRSLEYLILKAHTAMCKLEQY